MIPLPPSCNEKIKYKKHFFFLLLDVIIHFIAKEHLESKIHIILLLIIKNKTKHID